MKKINILIALFCALLFVVSCSNTSKRNNSKNIEIVETNTMSVDSLLSGVNALNGKEVIVEGVCTHICAHGGRKIFLMGSDDTKTIRIEATEAIGKFKQDCVNSLVMVKGKLVEDRIDEEYLVSWEKQVAIQEVEQHGEDKEAGCSTEKKARGEIGNTVKDRITNFRKRIADRQKKEGKNYLSFYHIDGENYEIIN